MWEISNIYRGISLYRLFPILVTNKIRNIIATMVVAMVNAMGFLWLLLWLMPWDFYGYCHEIAMVAIMITIMG